MLQRIGRYEIIERIAAGDQGTVYRARDTVLDRIVAIKVINQSVNDDPEYLETLRREVRLAGDLDHPNIIMVYDLQVEDDTAYVVMEYVPDSLDKYLLTGLALPHQRAVDIAIQVCGALSHAHENGMVHGDVKPQNILLTEDGTVKVSDFGTARALASSTITRGTRTMGSPWYMSLEQWRGSTVDGRADLYSLGVLLYEMLTGSVPFQGDTIEAIYVQHRESPVPRLPQDLRIPRAVEDVVRRAMIKRPDYRFANAEAMALTLEAALTGTASREQRLAQTPDGEAPVATPSEPPPAVEQEPQPVEPPVPAIPAAPPPRPLQQPTPAVASGGLQHPWRTYGGLAAVVGLLLLVVVVAFAVFGGDKQEAEPVVIEKEVIREVVKEVPVEVTKIIEVVKTVLVEKPVTKEVVGEVVITPTPTITPIPTYTPFPTSTPRPTHTPRPTYTPQPPKIVVATPIPTWTPVPTVRTVVCTPRTLLPETMRVPGVLASPLLQAQPPRPAVFGGTVRLNGSPASDGTKVSACIGGVEVASTASLRGNYSFMIAQPPGRSYAGRMIDFKVGGLTARETATWVADGGAVLNLTAVGTPGHQLTLVSPSGKIARLSATVEGVKFFEQGSGHVALDDREYRSSFDGSSSRYITWELHLSWPVVGERREWITVWELYREGERTPVHRAEANNYAEGMWLGSYHSRSYGSNTPGSYDSGGYYINFYVDGELVAKGEFEVY